MAAKEMSASRRQESEHPEREKVWVSMLFALGMDAIILLINDNILYHIVIET